MFGELPKFFDRQFVIGYILPVVAFATVSYGLIRGFDLSPSWLPTVTTSSTLVGTTVLIISAWLLAVLLLAVNRNIYMLLEGYGRLNPAQLFKWRLRRRYQEIAHQIAAAYRDHSAAKAPEEQQALESRIRNLLHKQSEQFPRESVQAYALNTKFGSAMSAWELYPWYVYKLDPLTGWTRLLAVVPEDYRRLIDDAKAQTDFWLNLWFLSWLTLAEYIVLVAYNSLTMLWVPLVAVLATFLAGWGARTAAIEWGYYVKSAFDVYLPDLATKLRFPSTATGSDLEELWTLFTQLIVYHDPAFKHGLDAKIDNIIAKRGGPLDVELAGLMRYIAEQLRLSELSNTDPSTASSRTDSEESNQKDST